MIPLVSQAESIHITVIPSLTPTSNAKEAEIESMYMVKNVFSMGGQKRYGFNFLVRKIPGGRAWKPTSVLPLENSMDKGARRATGHSWVKSRT